MKTCMNRNTVSVDLIMMVLISHTPSVITLLSVVFTQIQLSILLLMTMALPMAGEARRGKEKGGEGRGFFTESLESKICWVPRNVKSTPF